MGIKECKECKRDVNTSDKVCPYCGIKYPAGRLSLPVKIFVITFMLFIIGVILGGPEEYRKPDLSSVVSQESIVISPGRALRELQLGFQWSKSESDDVMIADFTIMNPLDYAIKDIEITCTFYSKSGDKINSNKITINDVVPSKERKVFKEFNMGPIHSKTYSTGCNCTNVKIVQ